MKRRTDEKTSQTAGGDRAATLTAIPRYQRISDDLRERVRQGEWAAGARLPGRQALSQCYEADIHTIERAVAPLLRDGLLWAESRRGTFVAEDVPARPPVADAAPPARFARKATATAGILYACSPDAPESDWQPMIRRSLERQLALSGITSQLIPLTPGAPPAAQDIGRWAEEGIGAIVALMIVETPARVEALLKATAGLSVPMLLVTSIETPCPVPQLFIDQRAAGYIAADHLLCAGYENITFLVPYTGERWLDDRVAGAQAAFRRAGRLESDLRLHPDSSEKCAYGQWCEMTEAERHDRVRRWTAEILDAGRDAPRGSGAIIAPCDWESYPLLSTLEAHGRRPGRDIGVVSFDDHPNAARLGLTSLRPPLMDLGETAARIAADALYGTPMPIQTRIAEQLIPRLSTRRQ